MGRVKLSFARANRPVVLHLDRAVAHDLLQALTQALEPHSTNTGKLKNNLKGVGLKAKSLTGKSAKGRSAKGKSPRRKAAKGKGAKKSR